MGNEDKEKKDKNSDKKSKDNTKKEKQNEVVQQALKDLGLVKDTSGMPKIPKVDSKSKPKAENAQAGKTSAISDQNPGAQQINKTSDHGGAKPKVRKRPQPAAAAGAPGQQATEAEPPQLDGPFEDPGYFILQDDPGGQ